MLLCSWEMVLPAAKAVAGPDAYMSLSIPSEQITPLGDREGHVQGTAQDLPRASAQHGEEHGEELSAAINSCHSISVRKHTLDYTSPLVSAPEAPLGYR